MPVRVGIMPIILGSGIEELQNANNLTRTPMIFDVSIATISNVGASGSSIFRIYLNMF
jgi:hypothetical protein